ncbi:hypothetical protein BDK51DRAFT_26310, partial [Blyttiomyces helicus]
MAPSNPSTAVKLAPYLRTAAVTESIPAPPSSADRSPRYRILLVPHLTARKPYAVSRSFADFVALHAALQVHVKATLGSSRALTPPLPLLPKKRSFFTRGKAVLEERRSHSEEFAYSRGTFVGNGNGDSFLSSMSLSRNRRDHFSEDAMSSPYASSASEVTLDEPWLIPVVAKRTSRQLLERQIPQFAAPLPSPSRFAETGTEHPGMDVVRSSFESLASSTSSDQVTRSARAFVAAVLMAQDSVSPLVHDPDLTPELPFDDRSPPRTPSPASQPRTPSPQEPHPYLTIQSPGPLFPLDPAETVAPIVIPPRKSSFGATLPRSSKARMALLQMQQPIDEEPGVVVAGSLDRGRSRRGRSPTERAADSLDPAPQARVALATSPPFDQVPAVPPRRRKFSVPTNLYPDPIQTGPDMSLHQRAVTLDRPRYRPAPLDAPPRTWLDASARSPFEGTWSRELNSGEMNSAPVDRSPPVFTSPMGNDSSAVGDAQESPGTLRRAATFGSRKSPSSPPAGPTESAPSSTLTRRGKIVAEPEAMEPPSDTIVAPWNVGRSDEPSGVGKLVRKLSTRSRGEKDKKDIDAGEASAAVAAEPATRSRSIEMVRSLSRRLRGDAEESQPPPPLPPLAISGPIPLQIASANAAVIGSPPTWSLDGTSPAPASAPLPTLESTSPPVNFTFPSLSRAGTLSRPLPGSESTSPPGNSAFPSLSRGGTLSRVASTSSRPQTPSDLTSPHPFRVATLTRGTSSSPSPRPQTPSDAYPALPPAEEIIATLLATCPTIQELDLAGC